jgi:probable F420-dependent oxidoreductase
MFLPEDRQYGRPKVMLAAVGPAMTRVAAEVADGLLCHSFTTERYLREVTLPAVEHVLQTNGRRRGNFRIVGMPFIAMGQDDEELENSIAAARRSVAFYASTPAYKPVLDFHGWGDIQPEMLRLSKLGRWQEMGEILDDEILRAFCVIGDPAQCAQQLKKRFSGVFDLACGYSYSRVGPGGLPAEILHELRKPE